MNETTDDDARWLIVEDGFDPATVNRYETVFTVGNGYLGTRGSLEEGHPAALPGTFLRGVFDHHDSAVIDLVNTPNWTELAVLADGTRLDPASATVASAPAGTGPAGGGAEPGDRVRRRRRPAHPDRVGALRQLGRSAPVLPADAGHPAGRGRGARRAQRHRRHRAQPGPAPDLRRTARRRPGDEVAQVGSLQAPDRGGPGRRGRRRVPGDDHHRHRDHHWPRGPHGAVPAG